MPFAQCCRTTFRGGDVATWNALAAITRAILGLLDDAYPRDRFGKLTFAPAHAGDYTGDKSPPDGCTLFLYRVAPNGTLRNLPPRTAPDGSRYRPSLSGFSRAMTRS